MSEEKPAEDGPHGGVQPEVQPSSGEGGRPCWVCGAPHASEEHVWPEWLKAYAANATGDYWIGVAEAPNATIRWTGAAFEHTSRVLCESCNRRFGDELESHVAQLIPRMFGGQPVRLDASDQRLLARWLYKTALMVSTTNRHAASTLPRTHYQDLERSFDLPPMSTVWIGRLVNPAHEVNLRVQRFSWSDPRLPSPPAADGYAFVETIKDVLAFAVVFDSRQSPESTDNGPPVLLGDLSIGRLQRVWPSSDHFGVLWPPPSAMIADEAVELLQSFVRQAALTGKGSRPVPS